MAQMTMQTKTDVKGYALWRVMQAQDEMRAQWELRMQECMNLHNGHVHWFHVRNYYVCTDAVIGMERKYNLR